MPVCCVVGCENRLRGQTRVETQQNEKKHTKVTFHKFPKDPIRRDQWIKAIRRDCWEPTRHTFICSAHFSENNIDRTSLCYVRLRENAVPTIIPTDSSCLEKVFIMPDRPKGRPLGRRSRPLERVTERRRRNTESDEQRQLRLQKDREAQRQRRQDRLYTQRQELVQTTTIIATERINIKEESIFEDEAHINIKEEPIVDIKEEPIDPLHEESIISNGEGSPSQVVQRVDTYRDAANMVTLYGIPAIYEEDTHFRNDCLQFANFVGIELQKLSDLNSLLVAKQCIKSVILDAQNGLYKNGVLPSILSISTNSAIKSERE